MLIAVCMSLIEYMCTRVRAYACVWTKRQCWPSSSVALHLDFEKRFLTQQGVSQCSQKSWTASSKDPPASASLELGWEAAPPRLANFVCLFSHRFRGTKFSLHIGMVGTLPTERSPSLLWVLKVRRKSFLRKICQMLLTSQTNATVSNVLSRNNTWP